LAYRGALEPIPMFSSCRQPLRRRVDEPIRIIGIEGALASRIMRARQPGEDLQAFVVEAVERELERRAERAERTVSGEPDRVMPERKSAIGCKPEAICSGRVLLSLTRSGLDATPSSNI
jgi:hypothetical protein